MPPVRGGNNEINRAGSSSRDSSESDIQPPRPPNAWILYRSAKLQEIAKSTEYGTTMAEISKVIGKWWKTEAPETKEHYNELAKKAKEEHARKYPDYKFRPVKKEDKVRQGPKPRASSRSTSGGITARGRAAPYQIPTIITAPATPTYAPPPILVHPKPQVLPMSTEEIYALQYHAIQRYGAAGPSPPMDAWDGDDIDIPPLDLLEPESPGSHTPPSSLIEPSPSSSISPLLSTLSSTPSSDSSGPHLFMPEPSASPDDLFMPPLNNFGWDLTSNETIDVGLHDRWSPDLQSMITGNDMNTLLLDLNSANFNPRSDSFDIDFGNLGSSSSGQPLLTPEYIPLPDNLSSTIDISALSSFDFAFVPTPPDDQNIVQPTPVRDPALQEQNLVLASSTGEGASEESKLKYQPPAGAAHSTNRRVGGNWRPRVLASD